MIKFVLIIGLLTCSSVVSANEIRDHLIYGEIISYSDKKIYVKVISNLSGTAGIITNRKIEIPISWGPSNTRILTNSELEPSNAWHGLGCLIRLQEIDGTFQIFQESIVDIKPALTPNNRSFFLFTDSTMRSLRLGSIDDVVDDIKEYTGKGKDIEFFESLLTDSNTYLFIRKYALYEYYEELKKHLCNQEAVVKHLLDFSTSSEINEPLLHTLNQIFLSADLDGNIDFYLQFYNMHAEVLTASKALKIVENSINRYESSINYIKSKLDGIDSNINFYRESEIVDLSDRPLIFGELIYTNNSRFTILTHSVYFNSSSRVLDTLDVFIDPSCELAVMNLFRNSIGLFIVITPKVDNDTYHLICPQLENSKTLKVLIPSNRSFYLFDNEREFFMVESEVKNYILDKVSIKSEQDGLNFLGKIIYSDVPLFIKKYCIIDFIGSGFIPNKCWELTAIQTLEKIRRSENIDDKLRIEIDRYLPLEKLSLNEINSSVDLYQRIIRTSSDQNYINYAYERLVQIEIYLDQELEDYNKLKAKIQEHGI